MKRIALLLLLSIVSYTVISMEDSEERIAMSRQVTKELFAALKGELEKALKTSTPADAIPVCKTKVPQIGKTFKEEVSGVDNRTHQPEDAEPSQRAGCVGEGRTR
uniref:Uncharacterized protein n=1 Tax=Candidatus Kentrum sp. UNK TaxID=2126344 RepID=A0A451ASU0_9GAMM|nr:MAG: hypothetical protein BECKUNK1418G_GA0071005_101732 [Candidatus Kentron sp. UNK]VFK69118.1 MAG: hypothetical protein BECKUNK1418H_GA0071006_101037 [Candidatus Kentron sp. UNK]